jgi:hypothetical protein
MSEYLNYAGLGVTSVLFILYIIFNLSSKGDGFILYFLFIILYVLLFVDANSQYSTATSSIKDFKRGQAIKCFSGGGLYTSSDIYRVSFSDGWESDKNYFTKGSLMIRANKCDKW